jgi:acetylornithine/succinyldiaminopimelate/putrescine aminotransferase
MLGVELAHDGAPYVVEALRRGLIINCTRERTLRLLPPFIVTARQVNDFLKLFEVVLEKAKRPAADAAPATTKAQAAAAAAR